MGRILIIGNGFDLAHGLKTSYHDLMNFIKEETNPKEQSVTNPMSGKCNLIHHTFVGKQNPYIAFKFNSKNRDYTYSVCDNQKENPSIFFKSLFNKFNQYNKWVDLESLYFQLLSIHFNSKEKIQLINKEFAYFKEILEDYLYKQIESRIGDYDFQRDNILESKTIGSDKLIGVINFNYTKNIISNYISSLLEKQVHLWKYFSLINIHGVLLDKTNPIIFGYGDDNSEKYKKIQDEENNELLINFKTFQYLRSTNYKRIMALLENRDTKVEIIGHSCGLSDKSLLKTIFEHPNVSSIEYRYHSNQGNYFENVYNISRIFSDNVLMRSKIKDLTNTRIIPQPKIELKKLTEVIP